MAIRLPKIHVPMTVSTDGVDAGLKAAEAKMRASTRRMSRMSAAGPGIGGGMLGKVGEAVGRTGMTLGGIGMLGSVAGALGPVGLAVGAIAGAAVLIDRIGEAARGAGEALKQFEETGKQTFAVNSIVLQRLAEAEKQLPKVGFFQQLSQGIISASATEEGPSGIVGIFNDLKQGIVSGAATLSAILSGKGWMQSLAEGAVAISPDDQTAMIAQALVRISASRDDRSNQQAVIDARRRDI